MVDLERLKSLPAKPDRKSSIQDSIISRFSLASLMSSEILDNQSFLLKDKSVSTRTRIVVHGSTKLNSMDMEVAI